MVSIRGGGSGTGALELDARCTRYRLVLGSFVYSFFLMRLSWGGGPHDRDLLPHHHVLPGNGDPVGGLAGAGVSTAHQPARQHISRFRSALPDRRSPEAAFATAATAFAVPTPPAPCMHVYTVPRALPHAASPHPLIYMVQYGVSPFVHLGLGPMNKKDRFIGCNKSLTRTTVCRVS